MLTGVIDCRSSSVGGGVPSTSKEEHTERKNAVQDPTTLFQFPFCFSEARIRYENPVAISILLPRTSSYVNIARKHLQIESDLLKRCIISKVLLVWGSARVGTTSISEARTEMPEKKKRKKGGEFLRCRLFGPVVAPMPARRSPRG